MNEKAQQLSDIFTGMLAAYGMNVIGAIVTLIFGFMVARWLGNLTHRAMQKADKLDAVFRPLPGKVVRFAIMVFTVIAVLNRFGVETTSLIALLGAAGLAIGLALQGTLSNVAAGVMILLFRPFKIGDAVKLNGEVYIVDSLGLFACRAHLPDGPTAFLPNSRIWGETIVNLSVTDQDMRRIDEHYGIGYGDDIGAALTILRDIAANEARVLATPAPMIKVDQLGDSSVNILFRVWTARTDWLDTKLDLIQRCKEGLEAGGITIPFPQRDVHLHTAPGTPAERDPYPVPVAQSRGLA
ncbi:MAG: mechanosensitive ion channel [Rubrivivax sp.]|nr:mechanosensitive ion channel [Rubrivivax sp.]